LKEHIPNNFGHVSNFIYYEWMDGDTLYNINDLDLFKKFLTKLESNLEQIENNSIEHIQKFYKDKTYDRLNKFISKNGDKYFKHPHNINGIDYPSYESFFQNINFVKFNSNTFYKLFHGDLQFDNIIYNSKTNTFGYIDWRESFGGYTKSGDIYYDLAKLYGGCIIPYNLMKDESNISYVEGDYSIKYKYDISNNLNLFKKEFEDWVVKYGFDLDKIKLITGLIFLNMSPLHDKKFSKMLWFKSIEILYGFSNK